MKTIHVEVAIIGAGTAGMNAYRAAREHTDNLILIEGSHYGTTCARVGCMPSKLLIAAAEAAKSVREASHFGVKATQLSINGPAVMARVRSERDRFVSFVVESAMSWPDEHRLSGSAKFLDAHRLQVGNHSIVVAERIVIATGSSPEIPEGWQDDLGHRLITNDDLFDWVDLPSSVAVFGGGVVGLELAQALHHLGVRVRQFGRNGTIGPLTDPEVKNYAQELFSSKYQFDPNSQAVTIRPDGAGVAITYSQNGVANSEYFDYVLATVGRRPNLQGLNFENTGLPLDHSGHPLFDRTTGQIGNSHVFIAGDVSGDRSLLHEAADAGRICGDNAGRYPDIRARPRRAPLFIAFSSPQIAMAGATHHALIESGIPFSVGAVSFEDQGRSRVMGCNQGLLRVYGEVGSGRFLGMEMIGPAAEHIGHLLAWAVQQQMTVQAMLDCPFYHPVIEEGVRTALRQLRHNLKMGSLPLEHCLDCGPGA